MSTRPTVSIVLLTRRWMRSQGARRSAIILSVVFAALAVVFVSVSAFTLSPDQQGDQSFGRYHQRTYTSVNIGEMPRGTLVRAATALRSMVPGGAHIFLETDQLRPDSFAKLYVQAPITTVRFVEDPGLRGAFPGRYTLERGVWPKSPNDVVVSRHVLDALPDRAEFTTLSGRVTFNVVGVVTDAYAKQQDIIVAGPGTWESIVPPPAGHQFQPVEAQVNVLSGAGAHGADIAEVLAKVLPPLPELQGERGEYIVGNESTRAQIVDVAVAKFGTDQIVVSYLPLFLVVLLTSALVVAQTRRAHQANADRLVAIGVKRRLVDASQATALITVCAGSIAAGLGLGWLVGIALRARVLPQVANQPLSPLPAINAATLAIAASCLVLITAGTLWPARGQTGARWSVVTGALSELHLGLIRRILVVTLVLSALRAGGGPTSVFPSYTMVAAVLLVAPDLLRVVVWALPPRFPRTFVTRRLMQVDLVRQAAAVVVIGSCLAIPICTATQLASRKVSDASYTFSKIPTHQVWLQPSDLTPDVSGLARIVSRVPNIGRPVVVKGLIRPAGPHGQPGASARFLRTPGTKSYNASVLVIDSAPQLRRLVGVDLPDDAEKVLNGGGVVDFSGARGDQRFGVVTDDADDRVTPTVTTLDVSIAREFSQGFGGAVLTSTARHLGLPISKPTRYIFPNVTPREIGAAVRTAVNNGFDSEFVQYAVPPPPPVLPVASYVFLAGLVLGGFAVLLTVTNGQARRLRSYAARMVSIGLGPRWALSVLGIQAAVVVGVGALMGVTAGVLGVWVTKGRYAVLDVPVLPIALICGATIAAAALATALAGRALTANERTDVT